MMITSPGSPGDGGTPNAVYCHVCGCCCHEDFLRHAKFTICRCTACGLRFLYPQLTADELRTFYDRDYFSNPHSASGYESYLEDAENHRATFSKRLRLMPPPTMRNKLLDVGAAAGYFVEQARLYGWDAEGVEPSEWAATHARESLGQPVTHSTLEAAQIPGSSFDAITLWEVIEHVPDPRALLYEAARVVRPGGVIVLSTPDAGSTVARLLGKRWPGWSKIPEHLFFFDRINLVRLVQECGFTVTSWRYVSITVTAGYAVRRLANIGIPLIGRLPKWIANRSVPVNPLYDLMLIARRL